MRPVEYDEEAEGEQESDEREWKQQRRIMAAIGKSSIVGLSWLSSGFSHSPSI